MSTRQGHVSLAIICLLVYSNYKQGMIYSTRSFGSSDKGLNATQWNTTLELNATVTSSIMIQTSNDANVSLPPQQFQGKSGKSGAAIVPPSDASVFFNVYLPTIDGLPIEIVKEQIGQIRDSSFVAGGRNITIYIVTVSGHTINVSNVFFTQLCREIAPRGNIRCIRVGDHVLGGGELDTLQVLYDYCQTAPDHVSAVYIHNKGSFHASEENGYWRQAMTEAVIDEQCLNPPNSSCNACGLTYSIPPKMFTMLFPGNFFAAKCQYVKRLHPPKVFDAIQRKMIRTLQRRQSRNFSSLILPENKQPWVWGKTRYTAEHWVGLHPNIQPCDLSVDPDYWFWQSPRNTSNSFHFSMFPRHAFNSGNESMIDQNPDERLRTYTLLPGLLWRMLYLYNAPPPDSSWIWTSFPDGDFWNDALKTYGHEFLNIILAPNFDRNTSFAVFDAKKDNTKHTMFM